LARRRFGFPEEPHPERKHPTVRDSLKKLGLKITRWFQPWPKSSGWSENDLQKLEKLSILTSSEFLLGDCSYAIHSVIISSARWSKIVAVGAGFMPARNPGESDSSGGGKPRRYEKNISRYAQLFTTLCIDIILPHKTKLDKLDFRPPLYREAESGSGNGTRILGNREHERSSGQRGGLDGYRWGGLKLHLRFASPVRRV